MTQLTHYNTGFNKTAFPITLICDHVTNAPNIGGLFRIADAFGVEKLIFCGDHIPIGRRMTKTSRSTEKYVNYSVESDIKHVITMLKNEGYHITALEITANSSPLTSMAFNINQPLALIIGDENFGVSEHVLDSSDTIVHIEMFGHNSSMNVTQATSIALYEMTKQIQKS